MLWRLQYWLPALLGGPPVFPIESEWTFEPLRGTLATFVTIAGIHTLKLLEIIFPITSLLIFRLILRRTWLAVLALGLLSMALFFPNVHLLPH